MKKFVIGIDYGTESSRVLLVDAQNGDEIAVQVIQYPHSVMDERIPSTEVQLGRDWALQHPGDYLKSIYEGIPAVIKKSGINPTLVIGIGIDFTSCTILPIDENGIPLCFKEEFRENPHSWGKLWKHHAAEPEALQVTELAILRKESFLKRYGGKISSEWMIPKILQVLHEAPEIYEHADRFAEASDWIVYKLTGTFVRNRSSAGFKGMWHDGFPEADFFHALHPQLENVTTTKLRGDVSCMGQKAGGLTPLMAERIGLLPGIAVASGIIDAHAAVPGTGVCEPGKMVMVMGTSTCHMLLDSKEKFVDGVAGVVKDGIIPGFYAYEAGQAAVGDLFGWFIRRFSRDIGHKELEQMADKYSPGETGLMALDWWNGNRSILMDADLSGLIVGLTLSTKPEEIYRALLEATAFSTRKIIETFEKNNLEVHELYACGGLPKRNRLLMQIYADVTGRTIKVPLSNETGALGAAMGGAVAAGSINGGYDNIVDAIRHMSGERFEEFLPNPEHVRTYDELYQIYNELHDYFGLTSGVLKKLKGFRT